MKNLGASEALIEKAEQQMGIKFPEELKAVWRISNGLELPGEWMIFPVFDPKEPRKTCSHIVHENSEQARWSYMDESFVSIAGNGTGNQLVLKRENDILSTEILCWHHSTNKTKSGGKGFDYILQKAQDRIDNIEKQIARSIKK